MESWALILAAGESSRMGKNKLLLPLKNKTIIEHVVDQAKQAGIQNIMMVLGAYSDDMLPIINQMQVHHCYNKDFKDGMLSSIKCGFLHLPAGMDITVIFLGDQPEIPGEVAKILIKEYGKAAKGIVIPVFRGKRGHPVLIHKKYRKEINDLADSEGLRSLIHKYSEDTLEVETDFPGILKDIDLPLDYIKLTNSK